MAGYEGKTFKWVGTRPIRPDGVDKVTGRANYGADMNLPGQLTGRILRSPHAHAKIVSIDTSKAEKLTGVKAVITGKDFPDMHNGVMPGDEGVNFHHLSSNIMAKHKVLYDGHAVAAVAATSAAIAEEALSLIDVKYEILPHVIDVDLSMQPDAPLLHDDIFTSGVNPKPEKPSNVVQRIQMQLGDPDAAFKDADVIVERSFKTKAVHQGYIEPHAAVAEWSEDGQCRIWCSSQGHFMIRTLTARLLKMEAAQIRVMPAEIGGGFGGKTIIFIEPTAVLLARKAKRPVRVVMSRDEVFRGSGPAPATSIDVKIGAKKDGTLVAATGEFRYQAGAFPGSPVGPACMAAFGPYALTHVRATGYEAVTNRPLCYSYRAPGAPLSSFAVESVLDEIAQKLDMDPMEIRIKNGSKEGTQMVYGPKLKAVGNLECLKAIQSHPINKIPLGPNQGRGLAAGFWFNLGGQSSAVVNIAEDGTATIMTGSPDIGGSRASMALMAAEVLGIDYSKVRPIVGDTSAVGFCEITHGSRVTFATGMAIIQASEDIVLQCRQRVAKMWEVDVDAVKWEDGHALPAGANAGDQKPLSLAQIAGKAARTGGPLVGSAAINAGGAGPAFGVHICDVEVDPETGHVTVLRYVAAQDAGKAIHPSYVEGQIQGGVAQGVGWALNEEYIYGEDGRLQNSGFLDYRIPVASDLPMIDAIILEVPNPGHPFGVRGVGEVPIVPPLGAIANAVARATGVRMTDLPLTPPKILAAIDAAK
ncbi:MAG: xanthine dehydrogenase family protein molybdopterin-binding subunit [Alphaproteobacteria bacterium]|nr:xanthine dehydrogenase family protein molybdopterin-binding subunit [Alphaproteobacteria bacterium]